MNITKFIRTTNQSLKSKLAIKFRLPSYNLFQYLILLAALGTVLLIVYFTSFEFGWHRVRLPVIYNQASSGSMEVSKGDFSIDPGYLEDFVSSCDRIVAIDDVPVTQFLNSGGRVLQDKIILLNILTDNYSPALTKPPENGQVIQLWSTTAASFTLDVSNCANSAELSNYKASKVKASSNCSNCLTDLPDISTMWVGQGTMGSGSLLKLNLSEIKAADSEYLSIGIYTLIILSHCLVGGLFFILQPKRLITAIFSLFSDVLALGVTTHFSAYYHFAAFEEVVALISFVLISILFLHFVLLFPDSKPLSRRSNLSLRCLYLISFVILALEIWGNFFATTVQNKVAAWEGLFQKARFLEFTALCSLNMIILLLKYIRSKSEERLRVRLAVSSIVIALIFPLLAFSLNAVFNVWVEQNRGYRPALFFLPTVLIPLVFTYAVLKNKLLGVGIGVRRFVVHSIITALVTVIYFTTSAVLTSILPFWQVIDKDPFLNVLFLIVLTIFIHHFFARIQKFVDRQFAVDPLNYDLLTQSWDSALVKLIDLNSILKKAIYELPLDYHYKGAALLVCHPQLLQLLGVLGANSNSKSSAQDNLSGTHSNHPWQQSSSRDLNKVTCLLLAPACYDKLLTGKDKSKSKSLTTPDNANFNQEQPFECLPFLLDRSDWNYVESQKWILVQDESLRCEVKEVFTNLGFISPEVAIPLKLGDELFGALVLGQKVNEYSPPPADELDHIVVITTQISASIRNSLLIAESVALAEEQKKLRLNSELIEKFIAERDNQIKEIRQQTLIGLTDAFHGEQLQELFVLREAFDQASQQLRTGKIPDSTDFDKHVRNLGQIITDFRQITHDLRIFGIDNDFIAVVRKMIADFKVRQPDKTFEFEVSGEEALVNDLLTEPLKMSLYRVIQESINNSIKHSKATLISTNLEISQLPLASQSSMVQYLLEILIYDDGVGVDQAKLKELNDQQVVQLMEGHHIGISILKHQVYKYREEYQAQLNFYSSPGSGFETSVVLYLREPVRAEVSFFDRAKTLEQVMA